MSAPSGVGRGGKGSAALAMLARNAGVGGRAAPTPPPTLAARLLATSTSTARVLFRWGWLPLIVAIGVYRSPTRLTVKDFLRPI
mmetsp:Transcript_26087/g.90797  ORF Transcript_26087/g.90797 Transcript_26087/m.90797 type:complete len:84 (+) Transcript_26087:252-503(+)